MRGTLLLACAAIATAGCGGKLLSEGGSNAVGGNSGATVSSEVPPYCSRDAALDCPGNAQGFSCTSNPEFVGSWLSCSTPTTGSGYCCILWNFPLDPCTPDNSLADVCPARDDAPTTFAYQCLGKADDPRLLDSSLTCAAGIPDADGIHVDFCCTLE
jgi:hypothetical protein